MDGVMAGLEKLAANLRLSVGQLLARTSRFGHGTTIATNAVLERSGAGSQRGRDPAKWLSGMPRGGRRRPVQ